jgi:HK97 family phage prohead protease
MESVKKQFTVETKAVGDRTFLITASTDSVDRMGDTIKADGWDFASFMENPVILWAHQYDQPPVAKANRVFIENNQLKMEIQFPPAGTDEFADKVFKFLNDGFLNAFSVGFIPKEYTPNENGGNDFTKQELLEVSVVPVPANPEALRNSITRVAYAYKSLVEKATPQFADLPLDMNASWDASKAEMDVRKWASSDGSGDPSTVDMKKYAKAHFWYDDKAPDPDGDGYPDRLGDYKLPFADIANGKLTAIWSGVVASMEALLGARGGVQIPDADRKKVYNHIVKYYSKANKKPPAFKEEPEEPEIIEPLEKAGRVLSQKNFEKLQQAYTLLDEVLKTAQQESADNNAVEEKQDDQPEDEEIDIEKIVKETIMEVFQNGDN